MLQSLGRYKAVFSPEQEQMMVKYIRRVDDCFFGLDRDDLATLAYEFASQNNLPHPFKNEKAGEQWIQNFRSRNPEIALRSPEPTSISRARGFNRPQVQLFFKNLEEEMEKNKFSQSMLWNVDETGKFNQFFKLKSRVFSTINNAMNIFFNPGIRTCGTKPPKVFSIRGKKQVGYVKASERGTLVTAVCCASAAGGYIPPALIFPRQKVKPKYKDDLPPDTLCMTSKNGWINSELFLQWLKFFVSKVKPTPDEKALLILDNHESHRSIEVIEYARANNVVILSLPPHTSHRVQPLDVSVYSSFKGRFEKIAAQWHKKFPGRVITLFDIGGLFAPAYLFAATPNNAISGFKATGITDCDINVFQERDFLPADVTGDNELDLSDPPQNELANNTTRSATASTEEPTSEVEDDPDESPSSQLTQERHVPVSSPLAIELQLSSPEPSPTLLSPEDIRPIPKAVEKTIKQRNKRSQKSEVLTSTPVKNRIKANHVRQLLMKEQKENKKQLAAEKKAAKAEKKTLNAEKKALNAEKKALKTEKKAEKKPVKKKALKEKNSDESSIELPKKKQKTQESKKFIFPKPPTEPERDDSCPCLVCGSVTSTSREIWFQCNMCCQWAHKDCSDYDGVGFYACDFCRAAI